MPDVYTYRMCRYACIGRYVETYRCAPRALHKPLAHMLLEHVSCKQLGLTDLLYLPGLRVDVCDDFLSAADNELLTCITEELTLPTVPLGRNCSSI